ncbi:DUF547 domain-containing protein [Limnobacter litoralis]|uniref:DUF547 domain-containing protein n=1 Tax=Limnobacter litoralis TaxID=481366 RepID=A0ABQ5YQI8_9BURK|nr:DUF547 domain-containing protein [Limnobacter litoralis]GLR25702.1 DUF547 domain-containing protein [Limnobacter litoralis]
MKQTSGPRLPIGRFLTIAFTWILPGLGLLGCSTLIQPPENTVRPATWEQAMQTFDHILNTNVDDQGRVNFAAIAKQPAALESVVQAIAEQSPTTRPDLFDTPDKVLAYHINAYNALAMYSVIQEGIPQQLTGLTFFRFFLFNRIVVGGETTTLFDYEKTIRKLGDPRIHFALNCMSKGCPRLPRTVFTAEHLNAQLDAQTRLFFSEPRNLSVQGNTVMLSEILKFYTGDFLAKAPSLLDYVNRYAPTPVPSSARIEFRKYDWTINRWPAAESQS